MQAGIDKLPRTPLTLLRDSEENSELCRNSIKSLDAASNSICTKETHRVKLRCSHGIVQRTIRNLKSAYAGVGSNINYNGPTSLSEGQ